MERDCLILSHESYMDRPLNLNRKIMKRKKIIASLLFVQLCILWSCDFYGNKDLGGKLTLWLRDGSEGRYDIVYCSKYDIGGCIAGIYVIPSADDERYSMYVKTAKSDDKWVIAKTIRTVEQKKNYWIIDKNFSLEDVDCDALNCDSIIRSNVIGPLDAQQFGSKLAELKISLKF